MKLRFVLRRRNQARSKGTCNRSALIPTAVEGRSAFSVNLFDNGENEGNHPYPSETIFAFALMWNSARSSSLRNERSSQTSFLKAEAYQRGWASGNARAAFEQGLRQSVDMWHTVYNMNPDTSIARPDQAAIDDFVASALSSFDESPMKAIAMQRYFHFNHAQPYQAWSSQRRFDIPSLPDPELESGQTLEGVVMRVPYPTTESQNNDNFDQVSDITRFETVAWDTEKHVK